MNCWALKECTGKIVRAHFFSDRKFGGYANSAGWDTIHHTTTTALYRDSAGRFRRDVTLSASGLADSGKPHTMIMIGTRSPGALHAEPGSKSGHKRLCHGRQGGNLSQKDAAALAREEPQGGKKDRSARRRSWVNARARDYSHHSAGRIGPRQAHSDRARAWYSATCRSCEESVTIRAWTTTYSVTTSSARSLRRRCSRASDYTCRGRAWRSGITARIHELRLRGRPPMCLRSGAAPDFVIHNGLLS